LKGLRFEGFVIFVFREMNAQTIFELLVIFNQKKV